MIARASNGLTRSIARLNGVTSGRGGSLSAHVEGAETVIDRYGLGWYLGFDEDREWVVRSGLEGAHSLVIGNNATDRAQLLNLVASQQYLFAARIKTPIHLMIVIPSESRRNSVRLNRKTNGIDIVREEILSGPTHLMSVLEDMYELLSKPEGKVRPFYIIHDIDNYDLSRADLSRIHQLLGTIANRSNSTLNFNLVMSTSRADALPDKIVTQVNLIALTLSSSDDSWAILGQTGMETAPRKIGASEREDGIEVFKLPASVNAGGFSQVNASVTRR